MDKQILVDKYKELEKEIYELQQIRIMFRYFKNYNKIKVVHEKIYDLIDEQAKLLEKLEWKK